MSKQMVIEEGGWFYPATKGWILTHYFMIDSVSIDGMSGSEAVRFRTKEEAVQFFNKPKPKIVWQDDQP